MRREKRREQVLTSAAEVFAEKGYHPTTIDDIVSRARIARGTFYLYFQDKRSIFDELIDRFMIPLNDRIIHIDPSLPPETCLRLVRDNIRAIAETTLEHKNLAKILISDAVGLDPEFDRKLLDFYGAAQAMLHRTLTRGQKMGLVRASCDVELETIFILGAFKELIYQITMRGSEFEIARLVETFLRHYRDGLLVLPKDHEEGEEA